MTLHKSLGLALCALTLSACATTGPDSVKSSKQANEAKPVMAADSTADFLVEMVDARLMDMQEGKLAAERGTRQDIRDYGQQMMREQPALLAELRTLAASMQVTVPTVIGAEKREHLDDLMKLEGEKFDKAIVKSLRIDHDRDVGEFKKATKLADARVAGFANAKLPMIESHLARIEAIEKSF